MQTLTRRQWEVLTYIEEYIEAHGFPPSGRELAEACGLGSPSGAHRMLVALERKGFIDRTPGTSRGVSVESFVDCSEMGSDDLALVLGVAEGHSAVRDAELAMAARHADPAVKDSLIRDALERNARVTTLQVQVGGLVPSAEGVTETMQKLRTTLEAGLSERTWPMFVVDLAVFNRVTIVGSENLADRDPKLRALLWRDSKLSRKSLRAAEGWLNEILTATKEPGDKEALRDRAVFMGRLMHDVVLEIDRTYKGNSMRPGEAFPVESLIPIFALADGLDET